MIVCPNCGMQLNDDAQICSNCGIPFVIPSAPMAYTEANSEQYNTAPYNTAPNGYMQYAPGYMPAPAPKKKKRVGFIIAISSILIVLAIAITITLVIVLNSDEHKQKSLEGAVELFFEAIEENDYDKYMSLVPPYWQEHLRASLDSVMRNHLKEYRADFNCDIGRKIYYEIKDVNSMDRYEFSALKKNFENWYDVTGEIESYVEVEIEVHDSKGNSWTFEALSFIEIDGVWYRGFGDI